MTIINIMTQILPKLHIYWTPSPNSVCVNINEANLCGATIWSIQGCLWTLQVSFFQSQVSSCCWSSCVRILCPKTWFRQPPIVHQPVGIAKDHLSPPMAYSKLELTSLFIYFLSTSGVERGASTWRGQSRNSFQCLLGDLWAIHHFCIPIAGVNTNRKEALEGV